MRSVLEEGAMDAVNPLTGLPVGTLPLQEVLAHAGVEFLKGMADGRYPMPPMAAVIPIVPVEVDVGRLLFRALPQRRFYNPVGSIHGGYASTLLDTAMGWAVHSMLKTGEGYTSLEIKVVFHRQITHRTGDVWIEGKVLARGGRIAAAEGRITDAKGELFASGTTTCLIFPAAAG